MISSTVLCAAGSVLLFTWWRAPDDGPSAAVLAYRRPVSDGDELPVYWSAPSFSYLDQSGTRFSDQDLKNRVWVSNFFFASCTSICPAMTAKMAALTKSVADPSVRFVSFSVDPDHDTPEALSRYAATWHADARWRFLSTDRAGLPATASGMRTFVTPPAADSPIQHTSLFTLTDGQRNVRGVYDSADDAALQRLVQDVARLTGAPAPHVPAEPAAQATCGASPASSAAAASPGAAVFDARGCRTCHDHTRIAPSLAGLWGSRVRLQSGERVTCDERYVRDSILEPASKVVMDYPAIMPSYRDRLSSVELDQLVEYVRLLGGARAPGDEDLDKRPRPRESIDPICSMGVTAKPETPRATYGGHDYVFCSGSCREQFVKAPAQYVARSRR